MIYRAKRKQEYYAGIYYFAMFRDCSISYKEYVDGFMVWSGMYTGCHIIYEGVDLVANIKGAVRGIKVLGYKGIWALYIYGKGWIIMQHRNIVDTSGIQLFQEEKYGNPVSPECDILYSKTDQNTCLVRTNKEYVLLDISDENIRFLGSI